MVSKTNSGTVVFISIKYEIGTELKNIGEKGKETNNL